MHFRKPETVPLLFIVAAVTVLLALGVWQVERLQWKEKMLADIAHAQGQPALGTLPACAKPESIPSDDCNGTELRSGEGRPQELNGINFRNVVLTGMFLYDKSLHMVAPAYGNVTGFYIVTPFKLEDDGRIILVNRGFSPEGKESRPEGVQTVRGVIRPPRPKRLVLTPNHPEENVWLYEDIPAMAQATRLPLTPVVVEAAGVPEKNVYPIPGDAKTPIRNDHLQYAITWFSLAIIALMMFGIYYRVPEKKT